MFVPIEAETTVGDDSSEGKSVEASSLDELDALWDEAKESLMKKN